MPKKDSVLSQISAAILRLLASHISSRNAEIYKQYERGYTVEELSKEHGLTTDIVESILKAAEAHLAERFSARRLAVIWNTPKFRAFDEELEDALIKLGLSLPSAADDEPYKLGNFNRELDTLGLSEGTERLLIDNGIMTIEELCSHTRPKLSRLRLMGETKLKEIEQALEGQGLSLAEKPKALARKAHRPFGW